MITFGLYTLAVITWGLGIRMPLQQRAVAPKSKIIEFRDKPAGVDIEETGGPVSFDDTKEGDG